MSGKIDYDELDRAVSQASKAQSRAKTTTTMSAAQHSATAKTSYPSRTRYMDFIAKPRRKNTASQPKEEIQVKTKAAVEPEAPRRVARFAPATADMPNYRVANSHPATKPHSIPAKPVAQPTPISAVKPVARVAKPISAIKPVAHITKPTPAVKAPAQPVARPAMRVANAKPAAKPAVAPKPVEKPVAPKTALSESEMIQAKNTAAAADAAAKALEKAPSSPNANNYSLGVRSPFIRNDAKVEKRPLGSGSDYVQDDKVGRNSYAAKAQPVAKVEDKKKTKVIGNKKQKSNGWIWPLIVVLIIAAGGGLGYLAYRVLENAL